MMTVWKRKNHSPKDIADISAHIRTALYILNGLFAIAGIMIVLKSNEIYGIGVTTDSVYYLSAAENLLAGNGYIGFDGKPYTHWPPLFPSLMALLSLSGIKPYIAGRFINAFSFGGIIFLSGILFHRRIKSFVLTIIGTLAILLSPALLKDCTNLWSEPVFIILIMIFVYFITEYIEKERVQFLILAAIFAALSCLQRYAGLTTIITGGILILFFNRKIPLYNRVKHLLLFGLIAVSPFCLWVIRNWLISPTSTAYEFKLRPDLYWWTVLQPLESVTPWLVTQKFQLHVRLIVIGGFLSALVASEILRRYKIPYQSPNTIIAKVGGIFCIVYTAFTIAAAAVEAAEANERLWSILFVFLVLLMLIGLEAVARLLDRFLKKPLASNLLVAGIFSLWLFFYCLPIIQQTTLYYRKFGSGISSAFWRNAPLADWLKNHRLNGKVFANDREVLYFLHGVNAESSPQKTDAITEFRKKLSSQEVNYLVWYSMDYYRFSRLRRGYMRDIKDLSATFQLEPVVLLRDGGVFIIR